MRIYWIFKLAYFINQIIFIHIEVGVPVEIHILNASKNEEK